MFSFNRDKNKCIRFSPIQFYIMSFLENIISRIIDYYEKQNNK